MNEPGSGASYELWTPPFDCSGQETVWLHFDAVASLSWPGTGAFDVDVTVNDGATWFNVFRRVSARRTNPQFPPVAEFGNTGGLFGRVDIDLSEPAANQPAVRVRFRHFEPTDSLLALDNIVVDDDPPPHLRIPDGVMGIQAILPEPTAELLFDTVDFTDGIPTELEIPADNWALLSLAGNSGNDSWTADDPGLRSALNAGADTEYQAGAGLYNLDRFFSIMDSLHAGNLEEDEYMITKPVDCSDLSAVYLVFDEEILWYEVRQEVLLSLDGGNSFECEPVLSYAGIFGEPGACDPEPRLLQKAEKYHETRSIQVPLAAGQSNVAFAFHYESEGEEGWWAVDNVTLYGIPRSIRFIRGDIDCNGTVNISDPIGLLGYLFASGADPCCLEAADAVNDGTVNISSSVYLLSFLFGGGSAPPAPFPACGSPTLPENGGLGCAAFPPCDP